MEWAVGVRGRPSCHTAIFSFAYADSHLQSPSISTLSPFLLIGAAWHWKRVRPAENTLQWLANSDKCNFFIHVKNHFDLLVRVLIMNRASLLWQLPDVHICILHISMVSGWIWLWWCSDFSFSTTHSSTVRFCYKHPSYRVNWQQFTVIVPRWLNTLTLTHSHQPQLQPALCVHC